MNFRYLISMFYLLHFSLSAFLFNSIALAQEANSEITLSSVYLNENLGSDKGNCQISNFNISSANCEACCKALDAVVDSKDTDKIPVYSLKSFSNSTCICNKSFTVRKDISDSELTAIANKISKSKNELDYEIEMCKKYVDARKEENYKFIKSSPAFTKSMASGNLAVFNILYQIAESGQFPSDTCIDYEINSTDTSQITLSFAFKRNYDLANATSHMIETAKIGYLLDKVSDYSKLSTSVNTVKKISSIKIHGFADQLLYAPKYSMSYLDEKLNKKLESYGKKCNDGKECALYEDILAAKKLDYPMLDEMTELENKLVNSHYVYPNFSNNDPAYQTNINNYISKVETNEYLALNRAIQTKRALMKYLEASAFADSKLKVGNNATSSCKNYIPNFLSQNPTTKLSYDSKNLTFPGLKDHKQQCHKRRTTIIEANLNSYFALKNEGGMAAVKNGGQSASGIFFFNCYLNNWADLPAIKIGDKDHIPNVADNWFDDFIKGKKGSAFKLTNTEENKYKETADLHYKRTANSSFSIWDLLTSKISKPYNNPALFKSNIALTGGPFKSMTSAKIGLSLTTEDIALILTHPSFYFWTFPKNNRANGITVYNNWSLDIGAAFKQTMVNTPGDDFTYFSQPRRYLDKLCAFTDKYIKIDAENTSSYKNGTHNYKSMSKEDIYKLIEAGPIKSMDQVYKGIDGNGISAADCIVVPSTFEATPNCIKTGNTTGGASDPGKPSDFTYPYFGFKSEITKSEEKTKTAQDGDILKAYLAEFDSKILNLTSKDYDTRLTNEIDKVNKLFCSHSSKGQNAGGYFKPTINEQEDCQ